MATLDAVSLIRHAIHDELGYRVPQAVPDPRPAEFVVVTRAAGRRENALVDRAGVHVECWAASEGRAREMADEVSDLMLALGRRGFSLGVDSVREEARRSDPDPQTGSPRWFASYTVLTHRH